MMSDRAEHLDNIEAAKQIEIMPGDIYSFTKQKTLKQRRIKGKELLFRIEFSKGDMVSVLSSRGPMTDVFYKGTILNLWRGEIIGCLLRGTLVPVVLAE